MNILLIHGLGRTPLSMWGMASALRQAGHTPVLFGYSAFLQRFDGIVEKLRDRLSQLSSQGPYGIVSHSLGGVLTRAALAQVNFPLPAHVVMLAPPNQSPRLGRFANQLLPYQWIASQSGQNLASLAFYTQLAPLTCPYTIIAGTAGPVGFLSPFGNEINDMIVGIEEVKMQQHDEPICIPAFHSFIMNHKMAQEIAVKAFCV